MPTWERKRFPTRVLGFYRCGWVDNWNENPRFVLFSSVGSFGFGDGCICTSLAHIRRLPAKVSYAEGVLGLVSFKCIFCASHSVQRGY